MVTMDTHSFLFALLLVFLFSRVFGELFAYLGLVAVLGEIFAGILLGPSGFGVIHLEQSGTLLKVLAEIGIMLLLFEIGYESDLTKLKSAGKQASVLAIGGALLPFIAAFCAAYYFFHLSLEASLFVGGTLTATSIGITMRVLKDIGISGGNNAQIILGAAVIDDLLGVLFLVFVYDFVSTGTLSLAHTVKIIFFISLFFLLTPILAKVMAKVMRLLASKHRVHGFIPGFIISMILLFSFVASSLGIPEILGSFAAGIAFSRRFMVPFASILRDDQHDENFLCHVKERMHPIIYLFSPIFFVYVGLSIDLRSLDISHSNFWILLVLLTSIAFLGKYIAGIIVPKLGLADRSLLGLSMIPRGEVGLIFAELGYSLHVVEGQLYAILVLVVVITTLLPPLVMKQLYRT